MTSQEKDRTKERRAQTPENFPCHKELVSKKRKAANIVPNLPEAEEREIIMDHFKKTGTLPPQSS
ncbi:hypothetical protein FOCC_FOCC007960 [Frankliniella occidentalis]|nr:hypothetical protein FOCC_FOCC007960 [Frankliniella occidentalis]